MANETTPFGDIQKIMDQFKVPGIDVPAIIEARRKDIEALVTANNAAFESMKALGAKQTEMFKQAMQRIQESANAAGKGVAVGDPGKQRLLDPFANAATGRPVLADCSCAAIASASSIRKS